MKHQSFFSAAPAQHVKMDGVGDWDTDVKIGVDIYACVDH